MDALSYILSILPMFCRGRQADVCSVFEPRHCHHAIQSQPTSLQ